MPLSIIFSVLSYKHLVAYDNGRTIFRRRLSNHPTMVERLVDHGWTMNVAYV